MITTITVGAFNYEHGGLRRDGRHELDPLIATIGSFDAPHILFLAECTYWGDRGEQVLWQATRRLSELLPEGDSYRPFLGRRFGSRNPVAVLVSTAAVAPRRWFYPRTGTSQHLWNFLHADVAGVGMWLAPIHFDGGEGRSGFERQAGLLADMAGRPALVGGDFNATSSWEREVLPDWEQACAETPWKLPQKGRIDNIDNGRWVVDTRQMDLLRRVGWWDAGEAAGDPTPTTNEGGSDHRYVYARFHLDTTPAA